jgi:Flp pilus assembly pilin Flp
LINPPGQGIRRWLRRSDMTGFKGVFVKEFFIRLAKDEQGQDLVEYALIVAAVGLALITTVNQLSSAIVSLYSSITTGLASIGTGGA